MEFSSNGVKNKMEQKYREIKERYDTFYNNMLKKGRLPMQSTSIGFWNAAITDEVFEAFRRIGLHRFNHMVDLGSGDGKVVLIASLFTNATGIEADPDLFGLSMKMYRELMPGKNVKFIKKNFFEHNLNKYDAVFCNPDQPFYRGLEQKLLKELNGKLIVYGSHFLPSQLRQEQSFSVNGTLVSVYSNSKI